MRLPPASSFIRVIATAALGGEVVVEPVKEGVSTYVYRLVRGAEVFYLRVLPEGGATFAPEAAVHAILRRQGVQVPEVVFWEDLNPLVARSVMITSEIKGKGIGQAVTRAALPGILRSAGRDLAAINSVVVDGFGWIRRDAGVGAGLRAELPSEREFMLADLDRALTILEIDVLGDWRVGAIRDVVHDHAALLDAPHAYLAHGDFDVTHIYCHQGRYSGIIDLGEIRGTGPYYDLGHFHFHDGETIPVRLLPHLLEGYQEDAPLPEDADRRIALGSLLIGVGFLARTHTRLAQHNRLRAIAAIERELQLLSA